MDRIPRETTVKTPLDHVFPTGSFPDSLVVIDIGRQSFQQKYCKLCNIFVDDTSEYVLFFRNVII